MIDEMFESFDLRLDAYLKYVKEIEENFDKLIYELKANNVISKDYGTTIEIVNQVIGKN
jgi:hypothetical protein